MNLECSSAGDKRFSAFYAQVVAFGKLDSIENHYQLCKRFNNQPAPRTWREAKGKHPDYVVINGKRLEARFASQFYAMLWYKYLYPELVTYAAKFDSYSDRFAKPGGVCQAEMIAMYVDNPEDLKALGRELKEVLNGHKSACP